MEKIHKIILLVMSVVFVGLGITVILLYANKPVETGFVIPAFEQNAVQGAPENLEADRLRYGTATLKEGLSVSFCGMVFVKDGAAELYFTASPDNAAWIRAVLLDEDGTILGESGVLRPGEYVKDVVLRQIPEETTPITLKILSYEPETYYSMGSATAAVSLILE